MEMMRRRLGWIRGAACAVMLGVGGSGCILVTVGGPSSLFSGPDELEEVVVSGAGRDKILLVDVSGVLTDAPARRAFGLFEEESSLARLEAELARAAEDERIGAVVLRINTPGGGVTASDAMYETLVRFKEDHGLPIIASLGDRATSGGYYVACAADVIIAHPTTVTGSIGVILMSLDLTELLAKVGVRNQTFRAGEYKDLLSPLRGVTPEERKIVQRILDHLHARFISIVHASRPAMSEADLAEATDGRVVVAAQARELGLVDEIGSLRVALAEAGARADLEEARVVMYRRGPEARETIYSRPPGGAPQVNVLPIDLGAMPGVSPRFMYLWAPGLVP